MNEFVAIGDIVMDEFIRLGEESRATIEGTPDSDAYKLAIPFAEKIPYEEVYVLPGVGNAPNAAVSAARLGLSSALVSNIGDDAHGKECLVSLIKDKVATEFVKTNPGLKTNYHYALWFQSERTILIKHEVFPYTLPDIGTPKWIYFSSVNQTAYPFHETVAEYIESHPDTKLAFQPGKWEIKLGKEKLARLYKHSSAFFCNVEEAGKILEVETLGTQELLKRIHALGPKIVVITDGPKGAYAFNGTDTWFIPPYPDPKPPFERTGAGDAFASTTVAALALGNDLPTALSMGAINSMSVVQYVGAQEGLLSMEQIKKHLAEAPSDFKPRKL
jgi:sugar/nucleoside kinase (ribokinase family)